MSVPRSDLRWPADLGSGERSGRMEGASGPARLSGARIADQRGRTLSEERGELRRSPGVSQIAQTGRQRLAHSRIMAGGHALHEKAEERLSWHPWLANLARLSFGPIAQLIEDSGETRQKEVLLGGEAGIEMGLRDLGPRGDG